MRKIFKKIRESLNEVKRMRDLADECWDAKMSEHLKIRIIDSGSKRDDKSGDEMKSDGYYSDLYKVVKEKIDKLDCYHLLEGGAPADEFDIEISEICRQITPESSAEEIADIIIAVFKHELGVEYSKESLMSMSKEIENVVKR